MEMNLDNIPPEEELKQKTATCGECGKEFKYETTLYGGCEKFPRKHCDACIDAAKEQRRRQEEQRVKAEKERLLRESWERLCPLLYRKTDAARLPQEPLNKMLAWEYGPHGILAHGTTGRGKTRAMYLLLRKLHKEGRKIEVIRPGYFGHEVTKRFSIDGDGPDWIERLMRVEVLFLDDFGKERFTERGEAEMFTLIEGRIAECKPILATMNFGREALASKLSEDRGEPLVRRLQEFFEVIDF
jgi:DNA replication protein DnaC